MLKAKAAMFSLLAPFILLAPSTRSLMIRRLCRHLSASANCSDMIRNASMLRQMDRRFLAVA